MPCYEAPRPPSREEILAKKMPAVLCALTTALTGQHPVWSLIDWQESGVTPAEFEEWWELHCQRDAARHG